MTAPHSALHPAQLLLANSSINDADRLPGGACNFRELGRGAKSPVCGCKRFWLDTSSATRPGNDNAWCFCGHHACFHNAVSQQTQRLSVQHSTALQTTEHDPSRLIPHGYVSVKQAGAVPVQPAGLGIRPSSSLHSQAINTRIWDALNGFARGQEADDNNSTRLPSTAVSFDGEAIAAPRPMGPPVLIPTSSSIRPGCEDFQGSATEVATPSVAGTPDLQAFVPPGMQTRQSPARPAFAAAVSLPQQTIAVVEEAAKPSEVEATRPLPSQEVMHLLQAHAQRLAALESLSFSQIPIEEVQDKFELFDGRLLDLEQWRGETEERLRLDSEQNPTVATNDLSKSRKRRLLPAETSSFASDESFDTTAAAHAEAAVLATIATNAELGPRIEDLQNRVADLEGSTLPTINKPWDIQVVFLPWGRNLRGIWFSSDEATQHSLRTSRADIDEWTGSQSQLMTSFRSSPSTQAWTTESIQAWAEDAQDWRSAKACGPLVFQRLASRGFVRNVSFSSADPHHINNILVDAFKEVLDPIEPEQNDEMPKYFALRQPIIPLRKVRKSSRLRFLSPAEMITPAVWSAHMLESSIFMKRGKQRRMFVTTPHAYLQGSYDGLSWQKIRQLPPRDLDGELQAGQVDNSIAIEACWSYKEKLDYASSLNTSFASQVSHRSEESERASGVLHRQSDHLTPALSGPEQRPLLNRTLSLPGSASDQQHDTVPTRRAASFETSTTVPFVATASGESTKRRRLSDSQEAEKRGVNFTPRWSREPPSPFHSEHAMDVRSQAASSSRKRGTTPLAYATPHSNSHFIDRADLQCDGDTEHDSDIYQDDKHDDEEWEGMDTAAVNAVDHDRATSSARYQESAEVDSDSFGTDDSLFEENEEEDEDEDMNG